MEDVAQLVRASVCGTEGRGFEPRLPPKRQKPLRNERLFLCRKVFSINCKLLSESDFNS